MIPSLESFLLARQVDLHVYLSISKAELLLHRFRRFFPDFPTDSRTLLALSCYISTPADNATYAYFELQLGFLNVLVCAPAPMDNTLHIQFQFVGLSLAGGGD